MNEALAVDDLACVAGVRPLFSGLSFRLPRGQWLMLTGTNGSGKSTMMRALAGLVRPTAGTIRWHGEPQQPHAAGWHARFVYQGHAAGWKDLLTVQENLAMQATLDGAPGALDAAAIAAAIQRVGLARQRGLAFTRLSAGQRRRLGLARLALAQRPLWLLDEPTTALDTAGQALLAELLDDHLGRGGAAVVATHQRLATTHPGLPLDLDDARASPPVR